MIRILAALALSAAFAAPALAEGMAGDMACKDFSALDHDGMMAAMDAATKAPDAMASDAMTSDAMTSEDGMMTSGDAMAPKGGMMAEDDAMAALVKTCADHPDMMVKDAMKPMN